MTLRGSIFLLILFFVGCADGIDCPFDTPSCCYNVLFGCGPFDLPSGCSCSRYGLSYHGASSAFFSPRAATTHSFSGIWSGTLLQESSECSSFLREISGILSVRELRNRIIVTVPGYGRMRGLKNSRGFGVSGQYFMPFSRCKSSIQATFMELESGVGSLQVRLGTGCNAQPRCSASYQGTIQRW